MQEAIQALMGYVYLCPMAKLLACQRKGGRLLISSMGLHGLQQYPEARALLGGIYRWLAQEPDMPGQRLTAEEVRQMIR